MVINVAVAIIMDDQHRVLITRRAPHISHGGYWEFPGGKLELYEAPEIALIREVKEEVGLDVISYRYLGEVHHSYETYQVNLFGYVVHQYRGEATCCESQTGIHWVYFDDLGNYQFPEANRKLMSKIDRRKK